MNPTNTDYLLQLVPVGIERSPASPRDGGSAFGSRLNEASNSVSDAARLDGQAAGKADSGATRNDSRSSTADDLNGDARRAEATAVDENTDDGPRSGAPEGTVPSGPSGSAHQPTEPESEKEEDADAKDGDVAVAAIHHPTKELKEAKVDGKAGSTPATNTKSGPDQNAAKTAVDGSVKKAASRHEDTRGGPEAPQQAATDKGQPLAEEVATAAAVDTTQKRSASDRKKSTGTPHEAALLPARPEAANSESTTDPPISPASIDRAAAEPAVSAPRRRPKASDNAVANPPEADTVAAKADVLTQGTGNARPAVTAPVPVVASDGAKPAVRPAASRTEAPTGPLPSALRSAARGMSGRGKELATSPPEANPARFISRVTKAFQTAQERGGTLQLRLSPPELGSLKLQLTVENGALTATLETERADARRLILEHLPALRDRLAEQNIRIERFDVDVQQDQSRGHSNLRHDNSQRDPRPADSPETQRPSARQGQAGSHLEAGPIQSASRVSKSNLDLVI